ncbi:MAG TPA: 30S ribosomal protein S6 [Anaerolineae bacterium]|nr:30S ribosomal protein S6 [Anaerolineae bacterium]
MSELLSKASLLDLSKPGICVIITLLRALGRAFRSRRGPGAIPWKGGTPSPMRDYEMIFIVHPEVDREGLTGVVEEVKGLIEANGGTVRKVEPWGLRRLAYPIQKVREGHYVYMELGLEPDGVAKVERGLKLKEQVIRHLIVRIEE